MFESAWLSTPGEYPFLFSGEAGSLEAVLTVPEQTNNEYIAMLGHPHSLHGGSMSNKVVSTFVRAFRDVGIPSIRFNFRGVGQSEGVFDNGLGESEDMLLLIKNITEQAPQKKWILAGFSFGSYVVYRVALMIPPQLMILVAPPVMRYNYLVKEKLDIPWWILQGDADEVVDAEVVFDFVQTNSSPFIHLIKFPGASHFFHGRLLDLREQVITILKQEGVIR